MRVRLPGRTVGGEREAGQQQRQRRPRGDHRGRGKTSHATLVPAWSWRQSASRERESTIQNNADAARLPLPGVQEDRS